MDRNGNESIWDLAATFHPYDPLALLAAVPVLKKKFMVPHVVSVRGAGQLLTTNHEIIGMCDNNTGVPKPEDVRAYLENALITGLTASDTIHSDMIVMSDDGKDLDDELAKILMASLVRRGLAKPLCFVANLAPSVQRARLAKGTLRTIGLGSVDVAIGSDMVDKAIKHSPHEFDAPYLADISDILHDPGRMCSGHLQTTVDGSVTVVLLSGCTDAWNLFSQYPELTKQKIGRVVLMSGVEIENGEIKRDSRGFMIPDHAQNNTFDMDSAKNLYTHLQENDIPMTVVTRHAAYAAKLPLSLYDRMAETGHPVGKRMQTAQRYSLEDLWLRCNLPASAPERYGLPARCDKPWFCKVFLGGHGMERNGKDSIWDLCDTFQAYDPMALLAAVPSVRQRYMQPVLIAVQGTNALTYHEVIGLSDECNGIKDSNGLKYWLEFGLLAGLVGSDESPQVLGIPQPECQKTQITPANPALSRTLWSTTGKTHSDIDEAANEMGTLRRTRSSGGSQMSKTYNPPSPVQRHMVERCNKFGADLDKVHRDLVRSVGDEVSALMAQSANVTTEAHPVVPGKGVP